MQFHKLTISVSLAIAAAVGLPLATHAATKYNFIAKQLRLQASQPQTSQTSQSQLQAESSSVNQARQTFFSRPPRLSRAAASQTGAHVPSTYEFTLTVPEDAGQPLKAIAIAQAKNLETVKFDISNSKASLGNRFTADSEIQLANIGGNQPFSPGEVTVVFAQPVQPGDTVTIALAVPRNPVWGGIYLFGVTAYPVGENGLGQFLGYGRINFESNSD